MRKLAVMKADKELQSLLDAFGKKEGAMPSPVGDAARSLLKRRGTATS
ncbi:MAG: hypothetical protein KME32_05115 [Mojavia pulchra JT2-VF2]|jgi:hypothetical protein|uniref:Uncharacterized protein n=1 Tax=Mojavia pulchra JT2-VF2 TaxID=287848 RepID=A0A951PX95_9NOST|nr:hypothetical protein [Mojavia pulchra JT2-VF2]